MSLLQWIYRTLSTHHSRDRGHLQLVKRHLKTAMNSQDNAPWKCGPCKRLIKHTQLYCPNCGYWWEDVADRKYVHQARTQAWDQSWAWDSWGDTAAPRPRTPRQRSSSAKRHGKGRGKEKGQTKTKDKSAGEGHGQPSPFLSAAPSLTAPIPPSPFPAIQLTQPIVAAPDAPAGPGADLIAAIRRAYPDSTAMPSEVRDALDRSEQVVNKQVTQDLHRATASLGRAQRAVRELEESRERHRQLWYQHLQESLKMWKDQMDGFDTQQEEYLTAIQKAKADMNQAHHNIQTLNARAAGKPPPEAVMHGSQARRPGCPWRPRPRGTCSTKAIAQPGGPMCPQSLRKEHCHDSRGTQRSRGDCGRFRRRGSIWQQTVSLYLAISCQRQCYTGFGSWHWFECTSGNQEAWRWQVKLGSAPSCLRNAERLPSYRGHVRFTGVEAYPSVCDRLGAACPVIRPYGDLFSTVDPNRWSLSEDLAPVDFLLPLGAQRYATLHRWTCLMADISDNISKEVLCTYLKPSNCSISALHSPSVDLTDIVADDDSDVGLCIPDYSLGKENNDEANRVLSPFCHLPHVSDRWCASDNIGVQSRLQPFGEVFDLKSTPLTIASLDTLVDLSSPRADADSKVRSCPLAQPYIQSPGPASHDSPWPQVADLWSMKVCSDAGPLDAPDDDVQESRKPKHVEWSFPSRIRYTLTDSLFLCLSADDATAITKLVTENSHVPTVTIRTHGFQDFSRGQRDLRIPLHRLTQWKDFVADTWRDIMRRNELLIILVTPQPHDPGIDLQAIVTSTNHVLDKLVLLQIHPEMADPVRTVVECTETSTGYTLLRRAGHDIDMEADYRFRYDDRLYYGFEILPVERGHFWTVHISDNAAAVHMQQLTVKISHTTTWRTWPTINEDLARILRENEDERLLAEEQNVIGPTTFDDHEEWIRIAQESENGMNLPVIITIFGLKDTDIGTRRITLTSINFRNIEDAVQGLWPHFDFLAKKVHLVYPKPLKGEISHIDVILEFYDLWNPLDDYWKPVLQECLQPELDTIAYAAHYCPGQVSKETFPLEQADCPGVTENSDMHVWVRGWALPHSRTIGVVPGDLIQIRHAEHVIQVEEWIERFFPLANTFKRFILDQTALPRLPPRGLFLARYVPVNLHLSKLPIHNGSVITTHISWCRPSLRF